jgi:hypothetical protein
MATFHAIGKPYLTILVFDFGVVKVTENILCAMFAFRWGFLHVSKDVSYIEDDIVLSFFYQVPDVNSEGMFWTITNGRYRIVSEHALNNFQDTVLTPCITTSMANIVVKGVMMKEQPNPVSHNSKFFVLMVESPFITLCDSFNGDDPSLLNVVVPFCVNF